MQEEICLLVDETDCIVGRAPKFAAHRVQLEPGVAPLHRAFSLFLIFRDPSTDKPQLLLQKRAASKITFPLQWANSCCSHPIANCPGEAEGVAGVILAACRKAEQELGIPVKLVLCCVGSLLIPVNLDGTAAISLPRPRPLPRPHAQLPVG